MRWLAPSPRKRVQTDGPSRRPTLVYSERKAIDTSGFTAVLPAMEPWPPSASLGRDSRGLPRGRAAQHRADRRRVSTVPSVTDEHQIVLRLVKAAIYQYDSDPRRCSEASLEARSWLASRDAVAAAVALQRDLFPGRFGDAAGRERELHPLPRAKARASFRSTPRPCIPSPRARGRPSDISPNISTSFPTTSGSSGS